MPTPTAAELITKARKRLEELEAEAAALRSFVASYGNLVQSGESRRDSDHGQLSLLQGSGRKAHRERIDDTINAARTILIREGRPMRRGELVQALIVQGHKIEGKDKNKVFGTNIWRSNKFDTIEGQGYWPRDIPRPSDKKS